ncbi:uncharacterized protein G2W53_039357 [Senna tora]|uniref:Uncharacterized protein n=1 Tax=Senna tora TaxID=362788 RepID=A0A834SPE9_9FABA|nr:uncharacterized protein G2W53_039357 [Senna tora]
MTSTLQGLAGNMPRGGTEATATEGDQKVYKTPMIRIKRIISIKNRPKIRRLEHTLPNVATFLPKLYFKGKLAMNNATSSLEVATFTYNIIV